MNMAKRIIARAMCRADTTPSQEDPNIEAVVDRDWDAYEHLAEAGLIAAIEIAKERATVPKDQPMTATARDAQVAVVFLEGLLGR